MLSSVFALRGLSFLIFTENKEGVRAIRAIKYKKGGWKIYSRTRTFGVEVHKSNIRVQRWHNKYENSELASPIVLKYRLIKKRNELLGHPVVTILPVYHTIQLISKFKITHTGYSWSMTSESPASGASGGIEAGVPLMILCWHRVKLLAACLPGWPGGPWEPFIPVDPIAPWSPCCPCGPGGPIGPCVPLKPLGPGGPAGPCGPGGPGSPFNPSLSERLDGSVPLLIPNLN